MQVPTTEVLYAGSRTPVGPFYFCSAKCRTVFKMTFKDHPDSDGRVAEDFIDDRKNVKAPLCDQCGPKKEGAV